MDQRLESVEQGNHIIAIYKNKETKLDEAFDFLKAGLDKNEIVMLITDEISKDKIRKKMRDRWNVNVDALESRDHIIIKTTSEWYFPSGEPNVMIINLRWYALNEIVRIRGKNGVRVFGDSATFFKNGFVKELINYESTLEQKFSTPFTAICAYDSKDIDKLSQDQMNTLLAHHNPVWK